MTERRLVEMIRQQTELIFYNMGISMKTCSRDSLICGVPSWRYFYHALHSCDKWFINPAKFAEPPIHIEDLEKVDLCTDAVMSDEDLWGYLEYVREKTVAYLTCMTDKELYENPEGCEFSRMELILGQFRHFMCHIGIQNGITIAATGRYPMVAGLDKWKNNELDGKLFDE